MAGIGTTAAIFVGGLMFFGLGSQAAELELGAELPSVAAVDQDGRTIDLAEAGGKGWTLVYFYPKADTPGCTKQACSLRDAFASLSERGVRVFGVSSDDVAAQKAFQEKHKLPFTLLADSDRKVIEAFGVPTRLGFASRQAFLFRDGELVWRDLSASTSEQAADVLAAIEQSRDAS
jgi:thioredoxin-dependent peroxiredoxin